METRRDHVLDAILDLLIVQDGVVARWQLLERGLLPHDIARLLRRRELRRLHTGVFVTHTGPLTRRQREWAAVLAAWPAALAGESALPNSDPGAVHVAVEHGRTLSPPAGVVVHRVVDLDARAQWHRKPPTLRVEEACVREMAARARLDDVAGAFAVLARVLASRRSTPDRVLATLRSHKRITQRQLLEAMVTDVRDGVCSVLERGYRDRVERAHGLPRGTRQHCSTATGAITRQDVRYLDWGAIVELDGLAFHGTSAARDADALRDLAELAVSGAVTARLTYGLVFTWTCRTAALIAAVLQAHGWTGTLARCPSCPPDVD